ncbi:hypothetical protein KSC_003940 [Ktedonobacter sp. SOSP1-52]|nr:hypothetical protein KSC_003940 [Ktedonobacter sp. SOSP1-52]
MISSWIAIEAETQQVRDHLARLHEHLSLMQTQISSLQTAGDVLHALQRRLHEQLEQPLSWEQVIEALAKHIHLETPVRVDGKKAVRLSVIYRFGDTMALCKTYPSPKLLQEHQEGQEHICWGHHRGL